MARACKHIHSRRIIWWVGGITRVWDTERTARAWSAIKRGGEKTVCISAPKGAIICKISGMAQNVPQPIFYRAGVKQRLGPKRILLSAHARAAAEVRSCLSPGCRPTERPLIQEACGASSYGRKKNFPARLENPRKYTPERSMRNVLSPNERRRI